jgi:hypothetical protein
VGQAARRIQRRKKALRKLDEVMSHPEHVVVIHYSCESFYDRPDGSSPRITSIAVANLESAQTSSFSIHQVAEREGVSLDRIEAHYDRLERLMLDEFYEYVRTHSGYTWLHWNMRNIHYGFQAIAHRYKVLGGHPAEIPETQLVDLSRLLHAIYGGQYIGHPRLQKLVEKNKITDKDFMSGPDEAIAFENGEYVKLHFSTLRKVYVLASIARRADEGSLRTNSTWRDIYGIYPQAIGEWLNEHWLVQIVGAIFAVIGFIATVIQLWEWFSH